MVHEVAYTIGVLLNQAGETAVQNELSLNEVAVVPAQTVKFN